MAGTYSKPIRPAQPTEVTETDECNRFDADSAAPTGTFKPNFDPERVKALRAHNPSDDVATQQRLGVNPYNKVSLRERGSVDKAERRSLDDMRRLSEEIQAQRQNADQGHAKTQAYAEQLRKILEIGPLRDPVAASHGVKLLRVLTGQSRANDSIATASAEIEELLRVFFDPTGSPSDEVLVQVRADLVERITQLEQAVLRGR